MKIPISLGNKISQGIGVPAKKELPRGAYFLKQSINGQIVTRRISAFSARQ
jgi:hypothetical protein